MADAEAASKAMATYRNDLYGERLAKAARHN